MSNDAHKTMSGHIIDCMSEYIDRLEDSQRIDIDDITKVVISKYPGVKAAFIQSALVSFGYFPKDDSGAWLLSEPASLGPMPELLRWLKAKPSRRHVTLFYDVDRYRVHVVDAAPGPVLASDYEVCVGQSLVEMSKGLNRRARDDFK